MTTLLVFVIIVVAILAVLYGVRRSGRGRTR